jgi:MFS family permease
MGGAGSLRVTIAAITRAEGSWRTRWGRWVILGLIGTVLGGVAARQALAHVTTAFVNSFGQLFTIAGLAMFVGALSLAALLALNWRRTTDEQSGQFTALAIPELLTNNLAYDRFLFFRLLYACGALADPFFILYATQELKAGGRAIAAYLLTLVLARAVATIGWRTLSSTAGNPLVLQLATFVRIIAPLTALTLPPLLSSATLRDHLDLAAPAIQGALTTPRERIAAQIVTGLVLALGTVAFPIGGLLLDRVGYSILFIIALLCGLVTLLAGGLLDEPGVLVLRSAPTERPALRRRNVHREG